MSKAATSLIDLCLDALKLQILHGEDEILIREVCELPTELFDCLLKRLSALALHRMQLYMSDVDLDANRFECTYVVDGKKRIRCEKFNLAWMELFSSRWHEMFMQFESDDLSGKRDMEKLVSNYDWRQKYWEMHLQNCFDAAAEQAMLPSFHKSVGDIKIPDPLKKDMGYDWKINEFSCDFSKLYSHCEQFGLYVRYLRFQNVLCSEELCKLLENSKLEGLAVRRINNESQVGALCRILCQNAGTVTSLELINCKLSTVSMDAICSALLSNTEDSHRLESLTVRASKLSSNTSLMFSPISHITLISFARTIKSLSFCDNQVEREFAKAILRTLHGSLSSCSLDTLENQTSGWLRFEPTNPTPSNIGVGTSSMQSLCVLNLRGNDLSKEDIVDLKSAVLCMPKLKSLDLSDNPVGDEGLRTLLPIFVNNPVPERTTLIDLKFKNCKLTLEGATELLEALMQCNYPLEDLSLADNHLGSKIAMPLGKFLGTSIRRLYIADVDLGPSGFEMLGNQMPQEAATLVCIDLSQNRGGYQAARFIVKLLDQAPEMVSVTAAYNLMPSESMEIIYNAIENRGKVQFLNLNGNPNLCNSGYASKIAGLRKNGKPVVLIPRCSEPEAPYDDDP